MNELVKGALLALTATALLAGCAPMDTAAPEEDEADIGVTAEALVTSTGALVTGQAEASAVLLPNGKVLLPGGKMWSGYFSNIPTTAVGLYDPALGTWSAAPKMIGHHWNSIATLLNDGRVLLTGTMSPELYTASTNTWATTGSMVTLDRSWHSATLLADGRVLAVGGSPGNNPTVATAEIYDPATATWSMTGSMGAARQSPTLVTLQSGKVLAIGGLYSGAVLTSCEIYDPATGTWASTYAPNPLKARFTATLLNDGRVLLAGGDSNPSAYTNAAWLYNPATGTWSATGSMATARSWHTATLLANGKVLVAGGLASSATRTLELYDPATGTWSSAGTMSAPRYGAGAVRLPSGNVLLAGGFSNSFVPVNSAEIYAP